MRRALPFLLLLHALPTAAAEPISVIVHRQAHSVELYLSIAPEDAPGWLGGGLEGLAPGGEVPMDVVRREGTAAAADAMLARTRLTIDAAPAQLQAMSVMVHPEGTPLHFETPLDAQMAMSVCTAPDLVAGSTLADLTAYAGYHAWPVDGHAALTLTPGGGTAREVELSVFIDGARVLSERRVIGPGAPLDLPRAASPRPWSRALWGLGLVLIAAAGAALRRPGLRAE
jgi:hypothetical protein